MCFQVCFFFTFLLSQYNWKNTVSHQRISIFMADLNEIAFIWKILDHQSK